MPIVSLSQGRVKHFSVALLLKSFRLSPPVFEHREIVVCQVCGQPPEICWEHRQMFHPGESCPKCRALYAPPSPLSQLPVIELGVQ